VIVVLTEHRDPDTGLVSKITVDRLGEPQALREFHGPNAKDTARSWAERRGHKVAGEQPELQPGEEPPDDGLSATQRRVLRNLGQASVHQKMKALGTTRRT
jgi:hypothetical protein